jgi:hypothetical protein
MDRITRKAYKRADKLLNEYINTQSFKDLCGYEVLGSVKLDTIMLDKKNKVINIHFDRIFSYMPFREERIERIYKEIKLFFGWKFRKYTFHLFTSGQAIENLVPNFYRSDKSAWDMKRLAKQQPKIKPLVINLNKPFIPSKGLNGRHLAVWPSHGWYFESTLNRWEWQRARLFQTVEDLSPMMYVLPYIVPMLENAGANVFIPRERDTQKNEVIIDNDQIKDTLAYKEYSSMANQWSTGEEKGFSIGKPPYIRENPFQLGTYRKIKAEINGTSKIEYIPDIPESGEYAVYISWSHNEKNISNAHYTVFHTGGKTEFVINQKIGGETWIYLGTFQFDKGRNPESGKVILSNKSTESGFVTADAVRFGGGMGVIARNGQTSGRPKYVEGARYYLQYAGMPDSIVYNLNKGANDYNDDYQCRGVWVNYLKGGQLGSVKDPLVKGLGIPIDLSFAFHTDAGVTPDDKTIGTLGIYSSDGAKGIFPDSVSRMANRDLMDMIMSELIDNIRLKYNPQWTRRGLWDKGYSEAKRPNVPAALLELLSHQNFADMKYGNDPQYRFDVSRAIYKAILKFLSMYYQTEYVVQPLPVTHFLTSFTTSGNVLLKWRVVEDSLEKTATPDKYIVYTRIDGKNFDNGILTDKPEFTFMNPEGGKIYSFKVTAVNQGGESFPSEILSVCKVKNSKEPVLIVNSFDRISSAEPVESGNFKGFANFIDQGVPYLQDFAYVGAQYEFNSKIEWKDDDDPGNGASYGDFETTIIPGNTFDFPYIHGKSIKAAGFSFVSTSNEAIMEDNLDMKSFKTVDIILGEERKINFPANQNNPDFEAFPATFRDKLKSFCESGGNVFISGSYIGMDLYKANNDSTGIKYANSVLKMIWRTNHAVKNGNVYSLDPQFKSVFEGVKFNTGYNSEIYTAEAPDAIEPFGKEAKTILRYTENNTSAGILYKGKYKLFLIGFPFETILNQESRDKIMKSVLDYLK